MRGNAANVNEVMTFHLMFFFFLIGFLISVYTEQ